MSRGQFCIVFMKAICEYSFSFSLVFFFLVQNKALSSARQAALFKHLGTTASHNIYRLLVFLIWNLTICWAVLCTNDYEVRTCLAYCRGFYCWIFCLFLFLREIYYCRGIIEFFCFQFPCRNSLRKTFFVVEVTQPSRFKKTCCFFIYSVFTLVNVIFVANNCISVHSFFF